MTRKPRLVDVNASNIDTLPCCGVKNTAHEGRCSKTAWLLENFQKGVRAKILLTPDDRQCGYIEYLPGEYAWRGVDARGYLFIHCIWTHLKQYQHRGLAGAMILAALDDAAAAGMNGLAVMARDKPWLAGPAVFLRNGFTVVDTAPPDYSLLVKKLIPNAPDPGFKGGWKSSKPDRYNRGLTIICSEQCPHVFKPAREIAEAARREYGLSPRIVTIKTCREAQNAPTPYAAFAIFLNGRLLTDHQISRTRFRNIMNAGAGSSVS